MTCRHAQRDLKLQSQWHGLMPVIEGRSDLVFIEEDIINCRRHTVPVQRVVPYPVTKQSTYASKGSVQHAAYFDKKYQLVEIVTGVQKRKGTEEVRVRCVEYDDHDDDACEPISQIREDFPGCWSIIYILPPIGI